MDFIFMLTRRDRTVDDAGDQIDAGALQPGRHQTVEIAAAVTDQMQLVQLGGEQLPTAHMKAATAKQQAEQR